MRRRSVLSWVLGCWLLFLSIAGAAQEKKLTGAERARASASFERAEAYYKLQDFGRALKLYQKAYLISLKPALLFNIGQCYRKLGRYEEALHSYRTYLQEAPDSPLRDDIKKLIRDLESVIARGSKVEQAPPSYQVSEESLRSGSEAAPVPAPAPAETSVPEEKTSALTPGARLSPGLWLEEKWSDLRLMPTSTKFFYGAGAAASFGLITGALGLKAALKSARLEQEGDLEQSNLARSRALRLGVVTDVLWVTALGLGGAGYYLKKHREREWDLYISPTGVALSGRF